MSAATINNLFWVPDSKHEAAKKWLQRHLRKSASRNTVSLERPQTAPSMAATAPEPLPPALQRPTSPERPGSRRTQQFDSAPSRPDSGVIRHVNAWLDANENVSVPAMPLMEGLPYWRSATMTGAMAPGDTQYAMPIPRPCEDRPSTGHGQHVRSLCRRAKKVQVRMPSLLRTVSQRTTARQQANRQSSSMPVLHVLHSAVDSPLDRCTNAVPRQTTETREHMWSLTTSARVSQGDSTGGVSDAPTYFTGPPPPSYRSRPASIQTTSSFGCVDGLSSTQRQTSHQQTALRNQGMRGRLRELHRKLMVQHKQR
jgi:hypothetical protein